MHIQTLHLQNFRRFEEKKITFHPQFNVLIGENGSGKTAILEAISILLFPYCDRMWRQNDFPTFEKNVRRQLFSDNKEYLLPFHIEIKLNDDLKSSYHIDEVYYENGIFQHVLNTKGGMEMEYYAQKLKKELTTQQNLPLICYYNTSRLWRNRKDYQIDINENKENGSRLQGYESVLHVTDITFSDFIIRWKTLQDEEKVSGKPQKAISILKKAIINGLEDCQNIYYSYKQNTLVMENQAGEIYPFHLLSDGYRNLLAIFGDLAYRCYSLNPHLAENACKETEGIVIIDEIDLHLHPKWQVKIVDYLKNTFPKIQFIVTTHSPLIIQEMKHEEIVFLDETSDYEPNLLTPDSILMRIQGLPDIETPERKEKLQELAKIDIEMQDLKKQGDEKQAEIQALWTKFREIATQLDWTF